jgi:hypothetical protein
MVDRSPSSNERAFTLRARSKMNEELIRGFRSVGNHSTFSFPPALCRTLPNQRHQWADHWGITSLTSAVIGPVCNWHFKAVYAPPVFSHCLFPSPKNPPPLQEEPVGIYKESREHLGEAQCFSGSNWIECNACIFRRGLCESSASSKSIVTFMFLVNISTSAKVDRFLHKKFALFTGDENVI